MNMEDPVAAVEPLDILRTYFTSKIALTDAEIEFVSSIFTQRSLRKGEVLLQEGGTHNNNAFVAKGCLRLYSIDAKGEEHVVQFAVENWWIADFYGMLTGEPAKYYIDALEDSEILLLSGAAREDLCVRIPKFERFFRLLLERNYVATQRRLHGALSLPVEEQYLRFTQTYPAIVQRVPQSQIASYLGITPQSLSRIRREIAQPGRAGGSPKK